MRGHKKGRRYHVGSVSMAHMLFFYLGVEYQGDEEAEHHGGAYPGSGGGHGAGHGTGVDDGVGPGIARNPKVPPRVASTAAPVYPQALRDAGIGGRVVVRGVVGIDGRVESAVVVRSSGNSTLDNNALSAFYKWRFSAAKNDAGQKVRCYCVQGFPFVIEYK